MKTPSRPYIRLYVLSTGAGSAWVDVTGDLTNLKFSRGNRIDGVLDKLDLGTLSATVVGNTYTPATAPTVIRPGAWMRVSGLDLNGTWWDLWQGQMGIPVTTYTRTDDGLVPLTVLSGFDVMGAAARAVTQGIMQGGSMQTRLNQVTASIRPGVGSMAAQAANVAGTTANPGATFNLDVPGSALDRLTIVRNSFRGWLWAARDSHNVIKFRARAGAPPTAPVRTFTDTFADTGGLVHYYSDIEISHDGEEFITAVTLNHLANGIAVGPLSDDQAVAAGWPRRDQDITATDIDLGTYVGWAQALLGGRPLPDVTVKSITTDVLENRFILSNDLVYQPVRVKNAMAGINTVAHIIHEEHVVTPESWFVTFDLRTLDSSRSPSITSEPS